MQDTAQETPAEDVFIAPSIHDKDILQGRSYTHHSTIPKAVADDPALECVLGVDEAGRGPVLGGWLSTWARARKHFLISFQGRWSMVYSTFH